MTRKTELTGKIAVVTGAGSGIGAATARLLAARGATVHLADLNAGAAEAVARQIRQAGGSAEAHAVDVCDPAAVEALAKAVYNAGGRVDILHNNAGIAHAGNIEATTVEDWQQVIGVNLLGVAYGVQAFVPRMLAQGWPATIVNTASLAGLVPAALMAPYCASKYGVVGMTEALNAELSGRGIHVSAVCPGVIDTAIARTGIMRGDMEAIQGPGHRDLRQARHATGRGGRGRPARDQDPQDDRHRAQERSTPRRPAAPDLPPTGPAGRPLLREIRLPRLNPAHPGR
jgi:NAD(P)-dependent dehydrogenase (short-subunit alcohol dehydrogenase family)